jgi:multimeric flavodoxin WrbA
VDPARPLVVAVVGSPRKRSNAAALVPAAVAEFRAAGAACETISLRGLSIGPCLAHGTCESLDACAVEDDVGPVLERMYAADSLILGTPVHYENVSGQLKASMDRSLDRCCHDRRLPARAVGVVAVTYETGLRDALEALGRYVALSTGGEVPSHTCGGRAGDEGEAERDGALLAEARALGRAPAAEPGLSPA